MFKKLLLTCLLPLGLGFAAPSRAEDMPLGGLRVPTLFAAECMAIPFEPADVFDAPGGLRIGQLVLDHPEYARKTTSTCSFRPVAYLRAEGRGSLVDIRRMEVGYEEPSLAVFKVSQHMGVFWVQGRTPTGSFWVPVTSGRQYLSLERDLVQGLALLSESCDNEGRCQPLPESTVKLAQKAGEQRQDTCYGNAYDIVTSVTLPDGRRAYEVQLAEALEPKYGKSLPLKALVPTRDYRGRWTGFFYSRGC